MTSNQSVVRLSRVLLPASKQTLARFNINKLTRLGAQEKVEKTVEKQK